MDETGGISLDMNSVIESLENGSYLRKTYISTRETIDKITEFSNYLNSMGRTSLLGANATESQELINLLFNLKKNLKSAISEIGKSSLRKVQYFKCSDCEEIVTINPEHDFWNSIQNHEHSESLYIDVLTGKWVKTEKKSESLDELEVQAEVLQTPHTSNYSSNNNDHTDSGIDQPEEQNDDNCIEEPPLGDNSFRFNFTLRYDPIILKWLYPKAIASLSIRGYQYNCVQRCNPFMAICLLCSVDLKSIKKINKKQCMDHVLGQKHMKNATNQLCIEVLKNYHELFLNLDTPYQAQQVHFNPHSLSEVYCKLCTSIIPNICGVEHIQSEGHKKKVIKLHKKEAVEFYLLDLQVECYGIECKEPMKPVKTVKSDKKVVKESRREKSKENGTKTTPVAEHEVVLSINPSGNALLDILPKRMHVHEKYFCHNQSFIKCNLCTLNINANSKSIIKHISDAPHCQLSDVTQPKYNYFCELCNLKFFNETQWEKHFSSVPNRHSKVSKVRVNKLTEYECLTCQTIIFGDDISVMRHKLKTSQKDKSKGVKLADNFKEIFVSRENLDQFAASLEEEANNTVNCIERTMKCCKRIEKVLSTSIDDCKAYPFGSRVSGLGNTKSDLDLFIDIGDMYFGKMNQDMLSQCKIVKDVASILRKHKNEFDQIHEVHARTPIVKLRHIETQLECDLSFRHGLSVENTKFIKLCLDLQPITQKFILVLKKWSECNNLSKDITNYALAIMAIFYLQINGYLLSVKKLRELNGRSAILIDGWEALNIHLPLEIMKNHIKPYEHSLSKLLKDFFHYYKHFNYSDDTVCPLLGHTVKRMLFKDVRQLPLEMESYVKKTMYPDFEEFRFMSPFCIQDPFDLSHNLTKAWNSVTKASFVKLCQLSFQQLGS